MGQTIPWMPLPSKTRLSLWSLEYMPKKTQWVVVHKHYCINKNLSSQKLAANQAVEVSLYTYGGMPFLSYEESLFVFFTAFSEWIGKSGKTKTNLLSALGKEIHE
jgi:hypothetical protein